ncbi:MAG: CHAT domain-containing protein, partial [Acidobacteriota bacterium]|nr:CHAT domain-containing protein [Acidobacteriota bacterium]
MNPIHQPESADRRLAERLLALSDGDELSRVLCVERERINESLIRCLKDYVSHLVRTDTQEAYRVATVVQAAADLVDDPICHALAAHALAQTLHVAGHYGQAIEHYQHAETIYRCAGRDVEAARVSRAKVDALMYLGRYQEALVAADEARAIFRQHHQGNLLAQLEVNVGNIYHRLDEYQQALRCYDAAEQTFAELNEFDRAQLNFNRANQYTQLNEFDKALALYHEARRGYEAAAMPLLVNQTDYSIAWLYFLRGRFQESLKLFVQTQARANELGDTSLSALCDLDRAEVYLQLNMLEDVLNVAHSAKAQFTELQMNYERAKACMYLGIACMHLDDLSTAQQWLEEARQGFLAEGNQVYTALTDIYLGELLSRCHDHERAWQLCSEARMWLVQRDLPAKAAYAEFQQARLRWSEGRLDEAASLAQSALTLLANAEAPWLRYQIFHLLGNIQQATGCLPEAYESYKQAVHYLEAMRSSIRADEYKCAFIRDKQCVYEDLVSLCFAAGASDKINEAFGYVEAAKARSLAELLASNRDIRGKADDPSVAALQEQWTRLREELDYFYAKLNHAEARTDQRPSWLGPHLHEAIRQREQQLAHVARQLSVTDAEYAGLYTTPSLDAEHVCGMLAEDEALIEYFFVNGHVKIFAFDHQTWGVFDGAASMDQIASLLQWVRFYLDQFAMNSSGFGKPLGDPEKPVRHYLRHLYAALMAPVETFVKDRKVIIAPHGLLHYVPFHALHDGAQYLVDR